MTDYDPGRSPQPPIDGESTWLQKELSEAHKTIRSLLRQLSKGTDTPRRNSPRL